MRIFLVLILSFFMITCGGSGSKEENTFKEPIFINENSFICINIHRLMDVGIWGDFRNFNCRGSVIMVNIINNDTTVLYETNGDEFDIINDLFFDYTENKISFLKMDNSYDDTIITIDTLGNISRRLKYKSYFGEFIGWYKGSDEFIYCENGYNNERVYKYFNLSHPVKDSINAKGCDIFKNNIIYWNNDSIVILTDDTLKSYPIDAKYFHFCNDSIITYQKDNGIYVYNIYNGESKLIANDLKDVLNHSIDPSIKIISYEKYKAYSESDIITQFISD